ncbi:hypothetical protein [Rickettsia endosymbiont of Rhinocyllus conicus]
MQNLLNDLRSFRLSGIVNSLNERYNGTQKLDKKIEKSRYNIS